ncbi:aldo/keto reductase [Portibacter marinus]|uniref:aldo/keto reductase n=1 Tax=Portibacter marinus TaxID=2898660 RepID=UPI001F26BC97|nr:aldo/keto reductase [Portibacter marinus]
MKYSKLGTTDIDVSRICLGTMTWGNQNTEEEGHQQMDYALDQGVNFWDTAEMYAVPAHQDYQGKTEEIIGSWFNKNGKRDEVILATKITGPSANMKYIRPELNFSKEQIHLAIEGSLKRLQTDYVDLYQLHWPERNTNFFGKLDYKHDPDEKWEDNFMSILETMDGLVKDGKIRHWGISNETPWGMMHHLQMSAITGKSRIVSIQNPYNLLNRSFEVGLAEMAIREKVGLLAYSPLAFGLLTGKYHTKTARPDARLYQFKVMDRYNSAECREATSAYMKIANEAGMSVTTLALAFINQQPFLTSNIIGATRMDQLRENIASIDVELDEDTIRKIDQVHKKYSNPAP